MNLTKLKIKIERQLKQLEIKNDTLDKEIGLINYE